MEEGAIVLLERSRIEAAAGVLARAFAGDPLYRNVFPEDGTRLGKMNWLMTRMLRYGLRYGHVYTTPAVEGVACWFPPGHDRLGVGDVLRSGLYGLPFRLGVGPCRRLLAFMAFADEIRARRVPEPHWYLLLLAVDRPHRRKGLGGRLMGPILEEAAAGGTPCYLETEREENLGFYRRHGFEVVEEGREPTYGVRTWGLRRG